MTGSDVAVIGYGPTGMTLAALLGQRGHRVVVLERYESLYNLPRAACFDDEIMRTFQKLGLTDAIGPGVVAQRDYDWINAGGQTLVELEYAEQGPGGWPALYMMYQPHVETVLDDHVRALPTVEIRQGFTVTELGQDAGGVTLAGTGRGGAQTLRARYVVGADGGSGLTRRKVCTSVDDYGFEENWLVCDFKMRRAVPGLPSFRQICDPAQPTSIVRIGPDHHRFSFMLNPGETTAAATDPARVWARVSPHLSQTDAELIRVANYMFRSRIAGQWRQGRVLLAGDAAHEMPPFLGQGMCSGIRDSHNLAWKLDLILNGRADPALLDTYQQEREPHVRFITEKAIELGRVQTIRDPAAARARDTRLTELRATNQKPEKLGFPGLVGRMITGDGTFFPQGRVRAGHQSGRFDDVVGSGWCIVASGTDTLSCITGAQHAAWQAIGGRIAVIGTPNLPTARPTDLEDLGGTYTAWFARHRCVAAVVRPDWYAYGTARDGAALAALLDRLQASLQAEAVPGSALIPPPPQPGPPYAPPSAAGNL